MNNILIAQFASLFENYLGLGFRRKKISYTAGLVFGAFRYKWGAELRFSGGGYAISIMPATTKETKDLKK